MEVVFSDATDADRPAAVDDGRAARATGTPAAMFEQLREHAPVLHVPELDAWVLSRYDDVLAVVRDDERFGCMPPDLVGEVPDEFKHALPHGYAPWQPALVNTDPPEHNRIRKLAQKPLTPQAVAGPRGRDPRGRRTASSTPSWPRGAPTWPTSTRRRCRCTS